MFKIFKRDTERDALKVERDKTQLQMRALHRILHERDNRITAVTAQLEICQKERDLAEARAKDAQEERRRVTDKLLILTGCGSLYDAIATPELPQSATDGSNLKEFPTNMRDFISEAELQLQKDLVETRRRNMEAEVRDKGFKEQEEAAATATLPVEEEIPA